MRFLEKLEHMVSRVLGEIGQELGRLGVQGARPNSGPLCSPETAMFLTVRGKIAAMPRMGLARRHARGP